METLYFSINPNPHNLILGNLVQFWFVTILALFIGYVIYEGLSSLRIRKEKFKNLGIIPRKWALLVAGSVVLVIIGFVYVDNWSYFYRIDAQKNNVTLFYFFPQRRVILPMNDINEFLKKDVFRKTMNYRLIINTNDGNKYKSMLINSKLFYENLAKLRYIHDS